MNSTIRALALTLVIAVTVTGCSDGPTGPLKVVTARLDVAPSSIPAGDSIRMDVTLHNAGLRSASVECPSWHLEVRHFDGRLLYATAVGPALSVCLATITLEPGASRTITAWWRVTDQDGAAPPPDTYSIRVRVHTRDHLLPTTTPAAFAVTP
jgi:hypothetical protein